MSAVRGPEQASRMLGALPRLMFRPSAARRLASREVVAGSYGPRDLAVRRTLAASDALATVIALFAVVLLFRYGHAGQRIVWGLPSVFLWIAVFRAYGMYDRETRRINHLVLDDLPWLFHALVIGSLLTWVYYHLTPSPDMDFGRLVAFGAIAGAGVIAFRLAARRLLRLRLGPERVLLLGDGPALEALAHKMRSHPEYGVEPIGFITQRPEQAYHADWPVQMSFADLDLGCLVSEHRVERLVIAHADFGERDLLELMRRCKQVSLKVSVLPQLGEALGPSVEIDDVEGITLLAVNPPVLSGSSRMLKRGMDLVGAAIILIVSLPLLLLIALAVKLDSRGPVLFRQTRIGVGGRCFELLKFRTMVRDAERMTEQLMSQSRDPHWLHLEHDPRITRVGRRLRLSSFDELPQLWNVLRGEMSLVGPRPLVESEASQLIGWARSRVDLMPGLTGLWQVLGRTSIPFEEMIKLDYLYVTNWTLWTDIRLILRTLPLVLTRRGAN